MRDWLGKVVGAEAEDLSRHDKWLCMMYPRLSLLKDFLTEDGAIFVSIDDNEVQNLRAVMDDVFGKRNFVATAIWQKNFSPTSTARHLSEDHDYVVVYATSADRWRPNLVPRTSEQDKRYKNPDNEPRGVWTSGDLPARNFYSLGTYPVTCPSGRVIPGPPKGTYWRVSQEKFIELDADHRIWWGKAGNNVPRLKRFLVEVMEGMVPQTIWFHQEVGNTQEAKKELIAICDFEDSASVFITPKPTRLLRRILEIATHKDSLILDSFAGSGTSGHAVLALNKQDRGARKFILVEMDEKISRKITAQRVTRAVQGYTPRTGDNKTPVEGLGGGFRYCTLGEPLFDQAGNIRENVKFPELAAHVFFTKTGSPIPKQAKGRTPFLGTDNGKAVYLLFNGVLGDKSVKGGNVLTNEVLRGLPNHQGTKVIYGEGCRLGAARLKREGIVFRQIPYEIKVS